MNTVLLDKVGGMKDVHVGDILIEDERYDNGLDDEDQETYLVTKKTAGAYVHCVRLSTNEPAVIASHDLWCYRILSRADQ